MRVKVRVFLSVCGLSIGTDSNCPFFLVIKVSRKEIWPLFSHHELKHKISTASTLLNRALNLPSTAEGVRKELAYVSNALKSNGYPSATMSNILKKKSTSEVIPSPEELVGMFF